MRTPNKRSLNLTVEALPKNTGVYVFRDFKKKILYIGKAKNLKNRIRSYFRESADLSPAKHIMVGKIASIETTVTDNENEALLLETSLIQKHKPPYNIMLKDDKYWQYIVIDNEGPWKRLNTVRRPDFKKDSDTVYFGPYTSGRAVKETLRLIKKTFPICLKLPKSANPKKKYPCFNRHLNRCPGPCVGEITPEDYALLFGDIKRFLAGSRIELVRELEDHMTRHSESHNFESAARIRDQINALKKLDLKQKVVLQTDETLDIVSVYRDERLVAVNVFKVRDGKLLDKFNTTIKDTFHTDGEIIEAFLSRYYLATEDLPNTIIVGEKLPSSNAILDIPVTVSMRGKKAQLLKLGINNAREYLNQKQTFFDKNKRTTAEAEKALTELKAILKLSSLPHRIETYDISNIHGKHAVGAMVACENGTMKKTDYRKFRIKILNTPDDPGMMAEMLERRVKRFSSRDKSFSRKPDIIVIDGGRAQINASKQVLKKHGYDTIPIIGLAKKEEKIYTPDKKYAILLPKKSPALNVLKHGRDEAHRFGLNYHRSTRSSKTMESELDEINGIGPVTRKKLRKAFGSIEFIKKASKDDLIRIIGRNKADVLTDYFDSRNIQNTKP